MLSHELFLFLAFQASNAIDTTPNNAYVDLGDLSSCTCLAQPGTCTEGATLTAWVNIKAAGGIITSMAAFSNTGISIFCTTTKMR